MFWWIAAGIATGFLTGAASRQPEINKLKNEVKRLQEQVEQLQALIEEQNQTINRLKYEYKALRATHFFEKRRVQRRIKGVIIFQYAYREFIELSIMQAKNKNLSQEERTFYNVFDSMIKGNEVSVAEKGVVKIYVEQKYQYEVNHLIELQPEQLTSSLGGINVA